jgi:hypothetical protein
MKRIVNVKLEKDEEGGDRGLLLMYYPSIYLEGLRKNHEIL